MWDLLRDAGELQAVSGGFRAGVRYASLGEDLFVHSAYPTTQSDAVFFGPDTYRYASLLRSEVGAARRVVDVGAGSGAGGLSIRARVDEVVLADISERALRCARVSAALADRPCEVLKSDVLGQVQGEVDLVISNPPYLCDPAERAYRDGGGHFGEALAVRIVTESLERLSPGGALVLYTGAAVVDGVDTFWSAVQPVVAGRGFDVTYRELDPEVFGEELNEPAYADAERIAAVALVVRV